MSNDTSSSPGGDGEVEGMYVEYVFGGVWIDGGVVKGRSRSGARRFWVCRFVVVGDVSLLRAVYQHE